MCSQWLSLFRYIHALTLGYIFCLFNYSIRNMSVTIAVLIINTFTFLVVRVSYTLTSEIAPLWSVLQNEQCI